MELIHIATGVAVTASPESAENLLAAGFRIAEKAEEKPKAAKKRAPKKEE